MQDIYQKMSVQHNECRKSLITAKRMLKISQETRIIIILPTTLLSIVTEYTGISRYAMEIIFRIFGVKIEKHCCLSRFTYQRDCYARQSKYRV